MKKELSIDFVQICRDLIRGWWLIAICVIVFGGFGVVKTLSPKYGISTIIEAFSIFLSQIPEKDKEKGKLEIYGKGELLEELKNS